MNNEVVWVIRFLVGGVISQSVATPQVVFDNEEVANAYIDKYYPLFDENDYKVVSLRVIAHVDDI